MAGERGADGGVTVQVDIGLASAGHLGARHVRAAVDGFATFEPFRFLRRHIAFVEGDFAIVADLDIDTPALALGRLARLPCRDILAARDDNHIELENASWRESVCRTVYLSVVSVSLKKKIKKT